MDGLTTSARHARSHNPVHHKTPGDIFQFLGDIVTQQLQLAAAMSTGIARRQNFFIAW